MTLNASQKSVPWINTIKAICIIAVFFVHCQLYYGYKLGILNPFIHTFYVNAFFFVSGYLLFWKQLSAPRILEDAEQYIVGSGKVLLFNVLFRIIIPSVLFSIIEFVPSCLIQDRGINVGFALYKTIGGGTYWFTSALVVAELFLFVMLCTRSKNIWFYVTLCFALGIAGLTIVRMGILNYGFWAWRQGLIALVFLALGGLYWRYEKQLDKMMRWWFIIPLMTVFLAIVVLLKDYNDPLISTLSIQPLGFVTSTMACLLLVWLCKKLPEMKPLTFIGQYSLGFYLMSGALPITFSMIAHKMMARSHLWTLIVIWLACLAVAYFTVMVINCWLPWLWDLRKISKQNSLS